MLIQLRETDLLLAVDVCETFMPGGGLAVPDGHLVVPAVLEAMRFFSRRQRFATKERHPWGHIAFASSYRRLPAGTKMTRVILEEQVREYGPNNVLAPHAKFTLDHVRRYLEQVGHFTLWTDHGQAGTREAELHPALLESDFAYVLAKGTSPLEHAYSAVISDVGTESELVDIMRERGFLRVFGVGLAFDYCVGWSLIHLADRGFEAYCIEDATRAVNLPEGNVIVMRERLEKRGVRTIQLADLALPEAA